MAPADSPRPGGDLVDVKRCPECGARFGIDAAFCPFDGTALTKSTWDKARDERARLRVDGRYDVLVPLGEGGMGTVYKVRHVTLGRCFAMKVLRRDLARDAELARRFVQEARATAAVRHPAVVAITDFGAMEDGTPWFVMELLEGETLASRLRARGSIPPRAAIRIAKRIAEGLGASHAAGVVHRDLKPENVFLIGKGDEPLEEDIRIVDFGAAKIVGASKLTRPGIVFGTPYYMAPEQASGQEVDARADVYSLGVVLYEMLTGRVPFVAETYMGVLEKHVRERPERPVPPPGVELGELEDVVMRALEKAPEDRFGSMAELAAALEKAEAARKSEPPRPPPPRSQTVRLAPPMTTAEHIHRSVERHVAAEERRKRRLVGGVIAAAIVTVAAGVLAVALVRGRAPAEDPAAASLATSSAPVPAVTLAAPSSATLASAAATAVSTTAETVVDEGPTTSSTSTTPPGPAEDGPGAAPVTITSAAPRPTAPTSAPRPRPTTSSSAVPPIPTATQRPVGLDDFQDPWRR